MFNVIIVVEELYSFKVPQVTKRRLQVKAEMLGESPYNGVDIRYLKFIVHRINVIVVIGLSLYINCFLLSVGNGDGLYSKLYATFFRIRVRVGVNGIVARERHCCRSIAHIRCTTVFVATEFDFSNLF